MKTGIELIAEERIEQMYKHGFDLDHDSMHDIGELRKYAALLCVQGTDAKVTEHDEDIEDEWNLIKRTSDDIIHRLKVAGALIAAEIDRLQASA
jgi:hypothetical protein